MELNLEGELIGRLRLIMRNKRGGVGNLVSMFVAIVFIFIILLVFVFIAGGFKKFNEEASGFVFYDEDEGEKDFLNYMDDYQKLSRVRALVEWGDEVDKAIGEVGYEK